MVVKYADNIVKGFAASLSIVTSALLSFMVFPDFSVNRYLAAGIVSTNTKVLFY